MLRRPIYRGEIVWNRTLARYHGTWDALCKIGEEWRVRLIAQGYVAESPVAVPPKRPPKKKATRKR